MSGRFQIRETDEGAWQVYDADYDGDGDDTLATHATQARAADAAAEYARAHNETGE